MAYDDNVLIKLRREYKKDEVVMYALNQIKDLRIENGKLNADIDELKDEKIKEVIVEKVVYQTIRPTNDTEIWFNKYQQAATKYNNRVRHITLQKDKQIASLERKIERQVEHSQFMNKRQDFVYKKLMERLTESEKLEFYAERDIFDEQNKTKICSQNTPE